MWSKSQSVQEPHGVPDQGQDNKRFIQKHLDRLVSSLQPTPVADERRRAVLEYVQELVQQQVPGSKIIPVGSFPLKTYLPYADVDMVMFTPPSDASPPGSSSVGDSHGEVEPAVSEGKSCRELGKVTDDTPGVRGEETTRTVAQVPILVTVNNALCTVAALAGSRRGPRPYHGSMSDGGIVKPEIRNVSFINARTPIVTMVIGNIAVDLTENQKGSVAAAALLEEADNQIQHDHLFKKSLLILKAWAWCETPRLVGRRVLGAQKGGLTSYGLSVMVLHLFASKGSADELMHPLDVFVRFFEVYSDFDWSRYCLTLEGPVPFGSLRQPRNDGRGGGSQGGKSTSRLQPLVKRILSELSPRHEEKEKEKEKVGRRGRRAGKSSRTSETRGGEDSSAAAPAKSSSSADPSPHFPKRDCNIQDPLNALNNLGHSVTKENLKAFQLALQRGRQQLETWQLLGRPVRSCSPSSDGKQRKPGDAEVKTPPKRTQGERGAGEKRHSPRQEPGAGAGTEDDGHDTKERNRDASPQPASPAAPAVGTINAVPAVSHHLGPPAQQYMLVSPPQAAHPGMEINAGLAQPVWAHGSHPGQPVVLALQHPFMQAFPPQYQVAHQTHPQAHGIPQGYVQMHRPYQTVLMPPMTPAHPNVASQLPLQHVLHRYQHGGGHQLRPVPQRFEGMNVLPTDWRNQANSQMEARRAEAKGNEKLKPVPQGAGPEGANSENGIKGRLRRRSEEPRDPSKQGSTLQWDLETFVNVSATSSTAALSDLVENGSKDLQDCQLQTEGGAESDVHGGGLTKKEARNVSSPDGLRRADRFVDGQDGTRGEGHGGGTETMSEKLWASSFLREVFPECCHRYGSGDGFREDLLDHPCQRKSKLQQLGPSASNEHGGRHVLRGDSRDLWTSLTMISEMMGENDRQLECRDAKGTEQPTSRSWLEKVVGAGSGERVNKSGGAIDARVHGEDHAEARPMDAVSLDCGEVDRPALSPNTDGDTSEEELPQSTGKKSDCNAEGDVQSQGGRVDEHQALHRLQVSIDDETDYTSEDTTSSSEPSLPAGECPSLSNPSSVSASTQTMEPASAGKEGGDKEMQDASEVVDHGAQCLEPGSRLMASCASERGNLGRISVSTGVQCGSPVLAPPVPRSTRCLSEDAAEKSPSTPGPQSSTRAELRVENVGTLASDKEREQGYDTLERSGGALPKGTIEPAPNASGPIDVSGGAHAGERDTSSKGKKRRKKPKTVEVKARAVPAALKPSLGSSEGSQKPISVESSGWVVWLLKTVVCSGVVFLLAFAWAENGQGVGITWRSSGLQAPRDVLRGIEEREQPPLWVKVGGSFTLGDVKASQLSPGTGGEGGGGGRVQWFKGGLVLPEQNRPYLTLSEASLADEGTYACYAVDELGRTSSRALWEEVTVRISVPPKVESQLQTRRLARGEMLAVVATATGVPQPEFQWRRNGVPIPGANRSMLLRHFVSEADMGTYTCDVYNVAGSVRWEEVAVVLRDDGPEGNQN